MIREDCPSFLGVPVARTPADLEAADAAIIGITYERTATSGRPLGRWDGYRLDAAPWYNRAVRDIARQSVRMVLV